MASDIFWDCWARSLLLVLAASPPSIDALVEAGPDTTITGRMAEGFNEALATNPSTARESKKIAVAAMRAVLGRLVVR